MRWKEQNPSDTPTDDTDIRGFSKPYISDTILDEVDQMKAKYLADLIKEELDENEEEEEEGWEEYMGDDYEKDEEEVCISR